MLISFLFAAIYKVLPDRNLEWGDVVVGAIVTGILFTIGKSLISWYIGSSAVASSFGAALSFGEQRGAENFYARCTRNGGAEVLARKMQKLSVSKFHIFLPDHVAASSSGTEQAPSLVSRPTVWSALWSRH